MMKKVLVVMFILSLVFVLACVPPKKPATADDRERDIVRELQEIERQLEEAERNDSDILNDSDSDVNITIDVDVPVEDEDGSDVDTSSLQRIEVEETELVDLHVRAEDLDQDNITYLFSPPLSEEGTWQTNYTDAGEYVITIVASDGENTVEKKVLLVVKKKNVAPSIRGLTSQLTADEGDSVRLEPEVVDLNEDLVTVTFSAPFDQNGQWKTDHTSAGEYDITVTASDGELQSSFNVTLMVANVNVPPEIIGLEDDIEIDEGQNVTLDFKVDDLDGDTVELSVSEPIGDDMFWATGYTDHGEYTITVAASDGKDTVSKEISLVVRDVNVPPTILNVTRR
jgi:nitrogen fixation protein FixH